MEDSKTKEIEVEKDDGPDGPVKGSEYTFYFSLFSIIVSVFLLIYGVYCLGVDLVKFFNVWFSGGEFFRIWKNFFYQSIASDVTFCLLAVITLIFSGGIIAISSSPKKFFEERIESKNDLSDWEMSLQYNYIALSAFGLFFIFLLFFIIVPHIDHIVFDKYVPWYTMMTAFIVLVYFSCISYYHKNKNKKH